MEEKTALLNAGRVRVCRTFHRLSLYFRFCSIFNGSTGSIFHLNQLAHTLHQYQPEHQPMSTVRVARAGKSVQIGKFPKSCGYWWNAHSPITGQHKMQSLEEFGEIAKAHISASGIHGFEFFRNLVTFGCENESGKMNTKHTILVLWICVLFVICLHGYICSVVGCCCFRLLLFPPFSIPNDEILKLSWSYFHNHFPSAIFLFYTLSVNRIEPNEHSSIICLIAPNQKISIDVRRDRLHITMRLAPNLRSPAIQLIVDYIQLKLLAFH